MNTKNTTLKQVDKVVAAALELAAENDWARIRMSDIAKEAKLDTERVKFLFPQKSDIVAEIVRRVDDKVVERHEAFDDECTRDRLFDVLMERFAAMNENRDGVISIIKSLPRDPMMALQAVPQFKRSMVLMLETAGVESPNFVCERAQAKGLALIFMSVLRVWIHDDTEDMAKTMAALDKRLGQAENFVHSFGFLNRGATRGGHEAESRA